MRLIGVHPKDIFCLFEISYSNLQKIRFFLNNSSVKYNGEKKEEKEAIDYITEVFNNAVNDSIKEIEDVYGSNNEGS